MATINGRYIPACLWRYIMTTFCDIDTRRACGVAPGKISKDKVDEIAEMLDKCRKRCFRFSDDKQSSVVFFAPSGRTLYHYTQDHFKPHAIVHFSIWRHWRHISHSERASETDCILDCYPFMKDNYICFDVDDGVLVNTTKHSTSLHLSKSRQLLVEQYCNAL